MSFKGNYKLTEEERTILECFKHSSEIGFPVDCGYTYKETLRILQSLIRKSIVVGRAPYRLTKLGKRLINDNTNNQ